MKLSSVCDPSVKPRACCTYWAQGAGQFLVLVQHSTTLPGAGFEPRNPSITWHDPVTICPQAAQNQKPNISQKELQMYWDST